MNNYYYKMRENSNQKKEINQNNKLSFSNDVIDDKMITQNEENENNKENIPVE